MMHQLLFQEELNIAIFQTEGGIVDDMIVYMIEENHYMLVVNASNIEKDWLWISSLNTMGVDLINISENISLLAVQGPKSIELLQNYTDLNLSSIKFYHFQKKESLQDLMI